MLPTVNKTHLAGQQTSGNTCRLEMVCQGRTKEGTYPTVLTCWGLSLPCFLHPHSRASTLHRRRGPAPTLQSVHSTQKMGSSPGAFRASSFLSCTGQHTPASHSLPSCSSQLKSEVHNAPCSEASPAEMLEGLLCPSGTDACLAWGL